MLTPAEIAAESGLSSGGFTRYRTIKIDNGTDIAGTGATGQFFEGVGSGAEYKKTLLGNEMIGTILISKAMLEAKGQQKAWMSEEFNPLNKNHQIALYKLQDGRRMKNPDGTVMEKRMTMDQIKKTFQSVDPVSGNTDSKYNYFVILYVLAVINGEKEVVKFKFKGTGRGYFFDYIKSLKNKGFAPENVVTKFFTFMDKNAQNKYAIAFDHYNNMVVSDSQEIMEHQSSIIMESRRMAGNALGAGNAPEQIEQPEPEEELETIQIEEEVQVETPSPIQPEAPAQTYKIDPSEIPFK